jgi:hypothetical protein
MPKQHPIGWLVEVSGGAPSARHGRFAVLADNLQRAKALVAKHVVVTNQRVELARTLTDDEVKNFALKPGEVREYGPKAPSI